ncbi:MAG TPA: diguanylate cyclase response regulator [Desulfobacteraceae bacterium]|nr:diguanylate cyclase response regulator [Desulfobacteraceae bacterium]
MPHVSNGAEKSKILIVDDATENIDILYSLLKTDYRVSAAKSGVAGLKMAIQHQPDVILLDIMMPEMDGYEVCRIIKETEETKNIPVIFVTAKTQAMDEARAFSLGAVDYITKPFVPIVVKARVKTHIALKRKNDMLEELVSLDGLTNIFNRRKFDGQLVREWRKAQRQTESLSVIFIDIDHFKHFNDTYGHACGDECLQQVAAGLATRLKRPEDFIARYGGEEFVIILPRTDLEGVTHIGESLIETVWALGVPHETSETADVVTISAGAATTVPTPSTGSPIELVKYADKMLYESKKNGRNRLTAVSI